LLAGVARSVIGVEIDLQSFDHSRAHYQLVNSRPRTGHADPEELDFFGNVTWSVTQPSANDDQTYHAYKCIQSNGWAVAIHWSRQFFRERPYSIALTRRNAMFSCN
jgi:hypothetical protein